MITSSFIFIPGIGEKTEERLWKSGILTWDDFKKADVPFLNETKKRTIEGYLKLGRDALDRKDSSFFAENLPQEEYWRLYKDFRDETLFLDIETTGLSRYYDVITLIGTSDGHNIKIFLRDNNLSEIVDYLQNFQIVVTFNGKLFDLRFIKKAFPGIKMPPVHIDLRYLLRSLGVNGSLKDIERMLGLKRDSDVENIRGGEAAVLWTRFVKGDDEALRKLVLYNIYDTVNLEKLMQFCYLKKAEKKMEKNILPEMKMENGIGQEKPFDDSGRKEFGYHLVPSTTAVPEIRISREDNRLEIRAGNETMLRIDRSQIKSTEIKVGNLINQIKNSGYKPLSVGIDLTGSENKASGICILEEGKAYLKTARTDEEIISAAIAAEPTIISIDSPLSLPRGRCCTSDSCQCRKYGILRECERILMKRGVPVYPCLIKSMQKLTARGIRLSQIFREKGFKVIESYPGAAQDILRFPRKQLDLEGLKIDLMNMGIELCPGEEPIIHDEIDALTSALVGYFYLIEMYEAIGNDEEGYLIIPDLRNKAE
ncbi:MAG TPA: ribonuclease H-like domain-containing protein [Candidatus Saccharicenans sp.]|nr:ribonuclease H-like domain-containing protein [Candidatus Saccharicenans sp.]HQM75178.1 ribonuclease H-like domain-containing protein [Candidatus Saccharicenans sp.]